MYLSANVKIDVLSTQLKLSRDDSQVVLCFCLESFHEAGLTMKCTEMNKQLLFPVLTSSSVEIISEILISF